MSVTETLLTLPTIAMAHRSQARSGISAPLQHQYLDGYRNDARSLHKWSERFYDVWARVVGTPAILHIDHLRD